jgi:hypothetical protein
LLDRLPWCGYPGRGLSGRCGVSGGRDLRLLVGKGSAMVLDSRDLPGSLSELSPASGRLRAGCLRDALGMHVCVVADDASLVSRAVPASVLQIARGCQVVVP